MSRNPIEDEVGLTAVLGDHLAATVTRKGKVIGFSESHGRGRAASGDASDRGEIAIQISGSSPKGEEGAFGSSKRLVDYLRARGESWLDPVEVEGVRNIDATVAGTGSWEGKSLTIQVVRAFTDPSFWEGLGRGGRAGISVSVSEAAEILKGAIEHKVRKIDLPVRATLTLVLDACDVPGLSLDPVIDAFNADHSEWLAAQGFQSVWVVGPWVEMVRELAALRD